MKYTKARELIAEALEQLNEGANPWIPGGRILDIVRGTGYHPNPYYTDPSRGIYATRPWGPHGSPMRQKWDDETNKWRDTSPDDPNAPWNQPKPGKPPNPKPPAYEPERYKRQWIRRRNNLPKFFDPKPLLMSPYEWEEAERVRNLPMSENSLYEKNDSSIPGHPDYVGPWMIPMAPPPKPDPNKPPFSPIIPFSIGRGMQRNRELDNARPPLDWLEPTPLDPPTPKPPAPPSLLRRPGRLSNPTGLGPNQWHPPMDTRPPDEQFKPLHQPKPSERTRKARETWGH